MPQQIFNVLILGASYGSLLSTKLLLAGHAVTIVCLPDEAELINAEGTRVRITPRGHTAALEIDSRTLPGTLSAATPDEADPSAYDLIVLAMQEPQYGAAGPRGLLTRAAKARIPCMSIMNMPPLTYLGRIPGLETEDLDACYTNPELWRELDPQLMTLASPDPQAFRPPDEAPNVLHVGLPTNFKVAPFASDAHTDMLREIEGSIDAARFNTNGQSIEVPVKLKVHTSLFVPMAKWSMLLAGNYRCIGDEKMQSIRDAVHGDIEASRAIYDWVGSVCRRLGAADKDLVPFEKYAAAAEALLKPSSVARAVFAGAPRVERVDRLVQAIGRQHGMRSEAVDEIVARCDKKLNENLRTAA